MLSKCHIAVGLLCCFLLGSCDAFVDGYQDLSRISGFGGEEEILPGKREKAFQNKRGSSGKRQTQTRLTPISLSRPYVNKEWTHEGGSPEHRAYHVALSRQPKEIWTASIGRGSNRRLKLVSQPVVANDVVFTFDAKSLVTALSLDDGSVYWNRDLAPLRERDGFFGGGLAYNKGALFITTGFAEIHALAARDGRGLWRQPLPAPSRAAPTVSGGFVYVVTIDNQILAFNASNGKEVWKYQSTASQTSLLGGAAPAVEGNLVLVGLSSGEVLALAADTGRVLWSDSLSPFGGGVEGLLSSIAAVRASPVIDRGYAYLVSHAGRMAAFDYIRGIQIWETDVGGQQSPAVGPDHIFVNTARGRMVALERSSGRSRWVRELSKFENRQKTRSILWYGPVLAGDKLILASSHGLLAFVSPSSGRLLGVERLGVGAVSAPIVVNKTLLVMTERGRLVAYR